ncbi:major facilitator superfamily domain-containing protein [Podospora appendiculata]|uniref:Major facilitator superfamily domain-containing protein n=1 Tax=Podospora appendiculata TaxID=314037 RepID=A0AAE1C721_9PEZI|nr:major facilitator superfamily domain-containing protein [Podospora appendiculata]
MTTADETTPLLLPPNDVDVNGNGKHNGTLGKGGIASRLGRALDFGVENRIMFAGFLITLSFSFTQVPLFYAFFLMECDAYYSTRPPYDGPPADRCSQRAIAAATAADFSVMGMSMTFCGVLNLFFAGWLVKRMGPRFTLMCQTFVPAIRVATQVLGVLAGGQAGIVIFQATQVITIFGGPVGYILVINIIVGEVVTPVRRTVVFGMLQGCFMLGLAIGYLTGGMIGAEWGVRRPFEVAFCAFLIATLYVRTLLPYISPESMTDTKKPAPKGIAGFFAPLKVISAQRIVLRTGLTKKHYGVFFLCAGVFLAVLATDFAPFLIQMYATTTLHFQQSDNGWLMSGFAFVRALFLLLIFPRIIGSGRTWYKSRYPNEVDRQTRFPVEQDEELPTHPEQLEAPMGTSGEEEPLASKPLEGDEGTGFDLFFLRWSLVADGLLTMCAAFATEKWHIYLAAFVLPFASGSAPAAKGVMTEMCPPGKRVDALNALTLVENIARLATQGLFGFVFSALAKAGKPHLTFFCNAAIAVLAAGVLLFSHFPPEGSRLLEDSADEPITNGAVAAGNGDEGGEER